MLYCVVCVLGMLRPSCFVAYGTPQDFSDVIDFCLMPPEFGDVIRYEEYFETAVSWRVARELQIEPIVSGEQGVRFATTFCRRFLDSDASEASLLALAASPDFLIPGGDDFLRRDLPAGVRPTVVRPILERHEVWRTAECRLFVESPLFRKRYVCTNLWQGDFVRFHGEDREVVAAFGIEDRCGAVRELLEEFPELNGFAYPNSVRMFGLMMMEMTSRHDLVARSGKEEFSHLYREWHEWFLKNCSELVQRRDRLGWIKVAEAENSDSESPGVWIRFPGLLLPDAPIPNGPAVNTWIRRAFTR
jgi:hypothetical protein